MGGIKVLGVEWRVSDDDFVFPAIAELCLRLLLSLTSIGGVIAFTESTNTNSNCNFQFDLNNYIYLTIGLSVCYLVNLTVLGLSSSQGVIWDLNPVRSLVLPSIYIHFLLMLIESCFLVFGTVKLGKGLKASCFDSSLYFSLSLISFTWIFLGIKLFLNIISFKKFTPNLLLNKIPMFQSPYFSEISNILAFIFHDSNFVPTDIASALILLHNRHKCRKNEEIKSPQFQDWIRQEDLAYYIKYASAAYGQGWYWAQDEGTWTSLARNLTCCYWNSEGQFGDNCMNCNVAALIAMLPSIQREDIIHISYRNHVTATPYYVAFDHEKKKIVIAIRGTLSLYDAMTDLMATPQHFENVKDCFVSGHSGMIQAAKYVFEELTTKNILNVAHSFHDDYQIIVTGHSLGAGTAVMTSYLLRSLYPTVKCFAYSPPGGLLCSEGALISKQFTVSVIVGDDIVPRLSLHNLDKLTKKMKSALITSNLPKYKILGSGICTSRKKTVKIDMRSSRDSYCEEPILTGFCPTGYESLIEISRDYNSIISLPLILPGIIYHVDRRESGFVLMEAEAEDFFEILVSKTMLTDHLPHNVKKILENTL